MVGKLRELWPVKRAVSLAVGFWDTFLRDNKVIPPVLAVAALFAFAWIVFGSFIGAPEDEPVSSQDEIAQSDGDGQPPAPEVENPNTDSYAAYQSKDPFRQLFQTPESTTQETTEADDDGASGSEDTTGQPGGDGGGGGSGGSQDTDGDGISTGNPGASDEQYDNGDGGQTPRQDPTDGTGDDTGSQPPQQNPQTPAPPNRPAADPANPGDGLFDSGGDLRDPNRR